MKSWKRIVVAGLAAVMAMSTLAGCSAEKKESGASAVSVENTAAQYNGQDVSKRVDLTMYIIGDEVEDEKVVLEKLNELLLEKINATLTIKHMSLSDYAQKYALTISSGEDIDVIYASSWAGYSTEATKGAFTEVTDEVLEKYMPLTKEQQPVESLEQARVGGKVYLVPANNAAVNGNTVLIRGDLREKYGIDPIKNYDDLENYYEAVAENEKGIFPYAASQNNEQIRIMMIDNHYNISGLNGTDDKLFYYRVDEEPGTDNVVWLYETEEYKQWVTRMKAWADKGFWSKNAVANNTNPRDAFTNGTSASLVWNLGTCGAVANQILESHPDWKPEVYDLNPDSRKLLGSYIGDGAAVLASSKNKERAFMMIDVMKFDEDCYNLVRLGVEGTHWIDPTEELGQAEDAEEKYWRIGERQAAYPFGSALSWPFKNSLYGRSREDKFEGEVALTEIWRAAQESAPLTGFSLDDSAVKNELANLNNAKTKYVPLLDLGLVDSVEETLGEFNKQADAAGLGKVKEAYAAQVDEYIKSKAE